MNQKVLNTLEYDKVIERLKAYATTELGKAACEKLEPMTDEPEISLAQEQTQDALTRLYKQGSISFFGVHDLGASLKRLKMKGTLRPTVHSGMIWRMPILWILYLSLWYRWTAC